MTSGAFILRRWQRAGIVAALAYALALQALLFAFGGALHAHDALILGPTAILCGEGKGAAPTPDRPAQAHDALCCVLSCGVSATAGALPEVAGLARPAALPRLVAFLPAEPLLVRSSGFLPVGSRAPPRLG